MESKSTPDELMVTITMTRPMAEAVKIACEMYLRLHMGQFWDLADDLCMAKFYADVEHNAFKTKEQRDNAFMASIHRRNDMQDELDRMYRRYVLPAPISDLMRVPYRAEQVWLGIRYALAWHDRPEGDQRNVCFDKPLNRSDQPQPKVALNNGWNEAAEMPPLTVEEWDNDGIHYRVEKSEPLILLTDSGDVRTGRFIREKNGDFWIDDGETTYCYNVTHWMPCPAMPKGWKTKKENRT